MQACFVVLILQVSVVMVYCFFTIHMIENIYQKANSILFSTYIFRMSDTNSYIDKAKNEFLLSLMWWHVVIEHTALTHINLLSPSSLGED